MKMERCNHFFRNLATPLKLEILAYLSQRPMSVTELIKKTRAEQSKISHALSSLRRCHIVEVKREGKKRIYSLNQRTLNPLFKIIHSHRKKFCKGCSFKDSK